MLVQQGNAANARLVTLLIGDTWDKKDRNSTAKLVAEGRADTEIVTTRHFVNEHYTRYAKPRADLFTAIADGLGCVTTVNTESYEYQGKRLHYYVEIVGHRSDVERAEALYTALASNVLGRIVQIDGKDTLHQRRLAFQRFTAQVRHRLAEIASLPSCSWVPAHRTEVLQLAAA